MASSTIQEDIQDAFHFYDNKGDKKIAAAQVGNCLRSLNLQPTVALIEKMTQQWNNNPEARVSIEEFTPIYHNVKRESKAASLEQFQNLMSYFDRDGSGVIMHSDLKLMLQNFGEKMTSHEVDGLLYGLDMSEGKVQTNDLVRLIMSL